MDYFTDILPSYRNKFHADDAICYHIKYHDKVSIAYKIFKIDFQLVYVIFQVLQGG